MSCQRMLRRGATRRRERALRAGVLEDADALADKISTLPIRQKDAEEVETHKTANSDKDTKVESLDPIILDPRVEPIIFTPTVDKPEEERRVGFRRRQVSVSQDGIVVKSEGEGREEQLFSGASTVSLYANAVEDLEYTYNTQRDSMVDKEGFISTPLHIVKQLALEMKERIHMEHYILEDSGSTKKRNKIYRVDMLVGTMRGVGQCTRKQLARQLAAVDIIMKIKETCSEYNLTISSDLLRPHGLLPGWRVDSMIYEYFHDVCQNFNLPRPRFSVTLPKHELGKSKVTCYFGDLATQAESDLPWLAKKIAAKAMLEQFYEGGLPMEKTLIGNEVLGFNELKLLGFKPTNSGIKRRWLMENRVKDTQVVIPPEEPYDGEMEDIEEEVKLVQSKKLKLGEFKETLKVTVTTDNPDPGSSSSQPQSPEGSPRPRIVVKFNLDSAEPTTPRQVYHHKAIKFEPTNLDSAKPTSSLRQVYHHKAITFEPTPDYEYSEEALLVLHAGGFEDDDDMLC